MKRHPTILNDNSAPGEQVRLVVFAGGAPLVIKSMEAIQPAGARGGVLAPGLQFGQYRIQALTHAHAMEEIYRARDLRLECDVQVNVALSQPGCDHFARFLDRWRTGSLFRHPNVVAVYDFGWVEEHPFLVTELLEGETLRDRLNAGPIIPSAAVALAMQIADGLAAAHRVGLVHAELEPENVFITPGGRVKIGTFAPARSLEETLELFQHDAAGPAARPVPVSSVGYLSPEQAHAAAVDQRADVFSLGVLLYEMLTGVAPFRRNSPIETLVAIVHDDLPDLRNDDPDAVLVVQRIVRRAVEKDPAERFQSALDLLANLELLLPSLVAGSQKRQRSFVAGAALPRAAHALSVPRQPS